jgi:Domain of unknown function (DUF4279)
VQTATFRLFGDATLTAEAVTRRLGVLPSRAFEVGDRVSRRSQATRGSSAWLLSSSSGIEDGTENRWPQAFPRPSRLNAGSWTGECSGVVAGE